VSPFLLLLGADVKAWAKPNADFTDFRTLDAIDLVRVVNAVCTQPVSEQFATQFDNIRRGRNKIQHLGYFRNKIDPLATLDILVDQWLELHPSKNWLAELRSVVSSEHRDLLRDDRFTATTSVLNMVASLTSMLTNNQRRKLLGVPLRARMFNCWKCHYEASFDDFGDGLDGFETAYLKANGSSIHCVNCEADSKVRRGKCDDPECGCDIIVVDDNGEFCAYCGESQNQLRQ
jgi:hypothetical protein